ncbi:50S ribosomal protein L11 methyltransferase [Geomesophilobacter sediminis]|uniref:Ribosomal protein L11 methyltransferase n=1 Tax=Geomesophilobacter sediminis TaxID=2798584 RepID=A0A8J7M0D9_9BACT|nr:50S ribosomal protein L11 methyltransferase [Geomesophilobacter sediminis]MBJ6724677.1 50S ribosomal protein L11 methyltransferase [Geomesophilobacter sediminis]
MQTDWAEITCEVPAALVETLADFLVELTGTGVGIDNLHVDTFSLDTLEDTPIKSVKAYLPADAALEEARGQIEEFLARHRAEYGTCPFTPPVIRVVKNEDWANNWKVHFKPVRIGTRMVIKPTWEDYQELPGDLVIQIDPGMAFGTGAHPTTRMCLESMERICYDRSCGTFPAPLLDVGTGSGVLSIAGALMGAQGIVAVDIDPEAVRVTEENVELNGLSGAIDVSTTPLDRIAGQFGVVVANILAEELVRLAEELVARVRPGGWLILSGILTEKEDFVRNGFPGLTLVECTHEEEWSCITLSRPAA